MASRKNSDLNIWNNQQCRFSMDYRNNYSCRRRYILFKIYSNIKSNMKKIFKHLAASFFFVLLTVVLFWQFFIKGLAPFPGNFMLAWYEPWKTDNMQNGTITIAHKPVVHDAFRQLYPFKVLGMENIAQFKLPLWNPYNGSGQPLFATGHMGYLNPLNLLYFITNPEIAWSLQVIIQPFLIGTSVFYFCRTLKLTKLGSILAGVSFMFSGFIITRTLYNDYNFAIFGMILSIIVIEKFLILKSKIIFALPFLIFLIITSTQPQIIAYSLIFIICYFLFRLWTTDNKNYKSISLTFLILFFLGIGFSAIQILPTFELYQLSNLTVLSSRFIFDRFLLPPIHLFSLFIPNYFGNQATYNYWGAGDYIESIVSIGLIPCFFAFINLSKKMKLRNVETFFFATILITIILAIKSPFTSFIYSLPVPVFSTGIPSRIFMLTAFSISVLSGFGLSKIINLKLNKSLIIQFLIFGLVPFLILLITLALFATNASCNNPIVTNCRTVALRNTLLEVGIFILALTLFFVYLRMKKTLGGLLLPAIILLVVLSGIYNAQKFLPFSKLSTFKPENELIDKIREIDGYERFAGLGDAKINSNFATYFRFYDNDYYDPLYIKRYGELVAYANGETNLKRSDVEVNSDRGRLFELTGTKYLIYRNNGKNNLHFTNIVWKNDKWIIAKIDALPRTYIVKDFQIKQNREILKALFDSNFDPRLAVILEESPTLKPKKDINASSSEIVEYKNEKVVIETETNDSGILVLSDNFYPGWKAYVNGKETKIFRANYTFRAIEIPPGKNIVEFVLKPESIKWSTIITIISFLIFSSFLYYYRHSSD